MQHIERHTKENYMAYSIGEGTTIRKMLGGTVKYLIPRYQRKYIWNDKQWEDLWDDLFFIVKSENLNIQHFFSTFIFEKSGNIKGIDNFNVIDGQQRLSTVMVILSAICRKYIELKNNTQHSLIVQYLTATDSDGKYIKISNDNVDLLGEIIDSIIIFKDVEKLDPVNISRYHSFSSDKKNIYKCYLYYLDKIEKLTNGKSDEEKLNILSKFTNAILDMQIVQIIVDKEQEGYDIFEILNARGTPLAQHELLKNYIFKFYKPIGDIDKAKTLWAEIESLLTIKDNSNISSYIDHYTIHKYGKPDKINTVLRIIKKHNEKNNTKEILDDIYNKAKYYRWLISPYDILDNDLLGDKKITENIYSILLYFVLKKQSQFRPLLISLFSVINKSKIDYETKEKREEFKDDIHELKRKHKELVTGVNSAITYLLHFSLVELVIKKQQPKIFEQTIHDIAQKIENGVYNVFDIPKLMPIKITKDMFISSFCLLGYSNKVPLYDRTNTLHDIRQIMRMYELYLQGTDELTIDNFTIEHILNDSKENINSCYIGNLLPLAESIQKEIGDEKVFNKKLVHYKTSQFKTVEEFVKEYSAHTVWNEKKIQKRSKDLAEIFYEKIFKLNQNL